MHSRVLDWIGDHAIPAVGAAAQGRILDIGGRYINGSPRDLFPDAESYTVLDLHDTPDVDVVADATTWQPDGTYDVVVCTEVLEHVADWHLIVATCATALSPGGYLILTCATDPRGPHGGFSEAGPEPGEHYENVHPGKLAIAVAAYGLESEDMKVDESGDLYCLARKP